MLSLKNTNHSANENAQQICSTFQWKDQKTWLMQKMEEKGVLEK